MKRPVVRGRHRSQKTNLINIRKRAVEENMIITKSLNLDPDARSTEPKIKRRIDKLSVDKFKQGLVNLARNSRIQEEAKNANEIAKSGLNITSKKSELRTSTQGLNIKIK